MAVNASRRGGLRLGRARHSPVRGARADRRLGTRRMSRHDDRGTPSVPYPGGAMTLAATFRSLHVRNFRLFVFGQIVSATGTWMQGVAAPWLVLNLTGSGVALGIDTALQFLPILLVGAWGGLIADRFDNRRVLVWTQIAFAIPAFTLWVLDATGVVQVWMVYVLSFLSGLATAVDMPTRQSFYLEMVG